MKITQLELIDYKCFDHLVLDNLGNRVVLVGPNGCGKSAILEAIAVVKEYIGTYDPNQNIYQRHIPLLSKHTTAWPSNAPLPIRSGKSMATINLRLALNEAESVIVGGTTEVEAGIRIDQTSEITPTMSNQKVVDLFRHFDPKSGISVFDYIAPDRQYPIERVSSLDMNRLSIDQQRRERIELPNPGRTSQKFSAIKQFIISKQLGDLSILNSTGQKVNSIEPLQELFTFFFGSKTLVGAVNKESEIQIVIKTPHGDHDIDQLSSGEKELFTIFTNLFRIRDFPAVILYDEPERHLNPGLESKIIPALDLLQTQNQLWIATHGTELIGSVPIEEIVALRRDEAGQIQPERFLEDSKTQRVRLFEEIGARVGLQLACNRVVFLEGKQTYADKRILDQLASPSLPGVLFVASGHSMDVQGSATRANLLIEKASKDTAFIMVLDRDYRDEASVENLTKRLSHRVFVWSCHEIENLLLNAAVIWEVFRANGCDELTTVDEIQQALLDITKSLSEQLVIEWATYRLHSTINTPSGNSPKDLNSYIKMVETRRTRLNEAYSIERAEAELKEARTRIEKCLSDGTWAKVLPGKEILEAFRKKYLSRLPGDLFREQIVSRMVEKHIVPSEIERLCNFIRTI